MAPTPCPRSAAIATPVFYADLQRYVFASENTNPFATTCLSNVGYRAGSDVLVVRYADDRNLTRSTPVGSLDSTGLYLLSNPSGGTLFRGNNPPSITAFHTKVISRPTLVKDLQRRNTRLFCRQSSG